MKFFYPLFMAVMVPSFSFAQAGQRVNPAVGPRVPSATGPQVLPTATSKYLLTHEDSLVLFEAGGGAGTMAGRSTADSLLHTRVRVLSFGGGIDTILRDFPYELKHLTGELVLAEAEFENYASLVELPGAQSCIVTRYHSTEDTSASWQAKMFNSEDFDKAAGEYGRLFRELKGCYVRLVDGSLINLNGDWEPARPGMAFTTSTLRLLTGDNRYREVKVELELVYQLADWVVNINIVSKKRDDEVGGENNTDDQ